MKISNIKIEEIFNRFNPRKNKTDLGELTASVKEHGILEPLIVRKDKEGFELIAGSRRLAAAEAAGLTEVPCSVLKADDKQAMQIGLVENMQREQMDPFDEADAISKLAETGMTMKEIGERIGMAPARVARRSALANLIPEWRKLGIPDEESGKCVSIGNLELIARYDADEQGKMVTQPWEAFNHSTKEFALDLSEREKDLSQAPFDIEPCATCNKRSIRQPELFDEDPNCKFGRCLDAECYARKVLDRVEAVAEYLEKKTGKKVLLIRDPSHYSNDPAFANAYNYQKSTNKDPEAVPVVIATGPNAGDTAWMKPLGIAQSTAEEKEKDPKCQRVGKQIRHVIKGVMDFIDAEGTADTLMRADNDLVALTKLAAQFGFAPFWDEETRGLSLKEKCEKLTDPTLVCWQQLLYTLKREMRIQCPLTHLTEDSNPYQVAELFCQVTKCLDFEALCAEAKEKFGDVKI